MEIFTTMKKNTTPTHVHINGIDYPLKNHRGEGLILSDTAGLYYGVDFLGHSTRAVFNHQQQMGRLAEFRKSPTVVRHTDGSFMHYERQRVKSARKAAQGKEATNGRE